MSSLAETYCTPEEYLTLERKAEYKSEYVNGKIYAMSGASREHILITGNVLRDLSLQLMSKPCEVYSNDMRVKVSPTGMYTYPDVVAVCGQPSFQDNQLDTLTNPTVIIEVLSPSTEAYDRGEKFAHYRRLGSLVEYVLIAQDKVRVEHFVRQAHAGNEWVFSEVQDGILRLTSIDCELSLTRIYDKIVFPDDEAVSGS